jgi:hypothetical protein
MEQNNNQVYGNCSSCRSYSTLWEDTGRCNSCTEMTATKPREIQIGEHTVLVDDEDYPFLARYPWHIIKSKRTNYAYTTAKIGNKKTEVSMHRLIVGLRDAHVDHRNNNGLDNRKENLRFATASQNSTNYPRKNKLGFRGVSQRGQKFTAYILCKGKRRTIYGFSTAEEAARAYDKMSKELHGEFGIRNFKD